MATGNKVLNILALVPVYVEGRVYSKLVNWDEFKLKVEAVAGPIVLILAVNWATGSCTDD
mgnify:CR=1 FL=1